MKQAITDSTSKGKFGELHVTLNNKFIHMKKFALIIAVVFVLALSFQSCKTTADCPAYGNANTEQPSVKA